MRTTFVDYPLLKDTASQNIETTPYYQHLNSTPPQDYIASVVSWLTPYGFTIKKHKLQPEETKFMRITYSWHQLNNISSAELEG